ncbi:MAG: OmpA family protein [Pseudomonadota bacterium]
MTKPSLTALSLRVWCVAVLLISVADAESLFDSKFPGAQLVGEDQLPYASATFYIGDMQSKFEPGPSLTLEGSVRIVAYQLQEARATLEVFKAYQRAAADLGYAERYVCSGVSGCGGNVGYLINRDGRGKVGLGNDFQYAVLERKRDGVLEVVHVLVMMAGSRPPAVFVESVKRDGKQADLEPLSADEISAAIRNAGAVAIHGLEFATDSAELLSTSRPALVEMAEFLKRDSTSSMLLVGHTDNQGSLEYNLDLSRRRAGAVRTALVRDFAISGDRLGAHGVGFLAPRALNSTAQGRARNRRVELVVR